MAIKTVTVVLAAFGGLVLLGSGATAAVAGVGAIAPTSEVRPIDVSGVQNLDAQVDGAELRIEFYDGDEAVLRADHGSTSGWTLRTDDDELQVRSPKRTWFGIGWFSPDWLQDGDRVTLQLPQSMAGLDADLTLNAGALSADGEFDSLDVEVSAGRMDLTGTANSLELTLNAGGAGVELDGVDEASFEISAGRADAELTGSAPREVTANVSAGQLNLTVPEGSYDVRQDVSAGSLNSDLRQDPDSANLVHVTVSAGTVNLREG
ncbi:DUF4097 family beta strand repeat-containing protein [Microbacterium sp. H1-D42]|uniref:DUF4097 family beta strand repeat-containing protein n=1 Tax=Microbacterium sp. H1-D42 TaxID=2925844 RepID=UPI001F5310E5|nr:DUF4097 family beta strand repeat-containing protein [Microbacterium sp. H1-D42]UNK70876.1 DUF4097 family beta strand repeat-containing protein [Microbacterium sp. H1-D42]